MRRVPKGQGSLCAGCIMVNEKESVKKRIHELREQIEYHTHLYYDLDAPGFYHQRDGLQSEQRTH